MNRKITKEDFLNRVQQNVEITHYTIYDTPIPQIIKEIYLEMVVKATFAAVAQSLRKGVAVHMPEVGTLESKKGNTPSGRKVRIRTKDQATFQASKNFR